MSTDAQPTIERFPWPRFKELADHAGVDITLAEELLKPELNQWVESLGLGRPDMSRFGQLLSDRLQHKVNVEGLSIPEAALYMGMTEGSFRRLSNLQLPALPIRTGSDSESRFLKNELDRFADFYLPSFKTWNTRTNLLREFRLNLESRTGFQVEPQWCELQPCEHLAAVVCANADCRQDAEPRKVCVAHREHLRDRSDQSLCSACVRRVLHGDLQSQYQIAGTRERLLRDYPHA